MIPGKALLKNSLVSPLSCSILLRPLLTVDSQIILPRLAPLRNLSTGVWSEQVEANWALYVARCASYFSRIVRDEVILTRLEEECRHVVQTWPTKNCGVRQQKTFLHSRILPESLTSLTSWIRSAATSQKSW